MSIILRIVIVFLLVGLFQFYFVKIASKSIKHAWPGADWKKHKFPLIALLIFLNLYPFFLLVFFLKGTALPDNRLTDYLIVYPFWGYVLIVIQCSLLFLLIIPYIESTNRISGILSTTLSF